MSQTVQNYDDQSSSHVSNYGNEDNEAKNGKEEDQKSDKDDDQQQEEESEYDEEEEEEAEDGEEENVGDEDSINNRENNGDVEEEKQSEVALEGDRNVQRTSERKRLVEESKNASNDYVDQMSDRELDQVAQQYKKQSQLSSLNPSQQNSTRPH